MPFELAIGGTERTALWCPGSLRIVEELGGRTQASFQLIDKTCTYIPSPGDQILFSDPSITPPSPPGWLPSPPISGSILWAGTISRVQSTYRDESSAAEHAIDAEDWNATCDRYYLTWAWRNKTLKQIVQDICSESSPPSVTYGALHDFYTEGFEATSFVATGPTIDRFLCNWSTVAEAFNQLAKISGYIWWIDAYRYLHFCKPTAMAAPFGISETTRNWSNLNATRDLSDYRNRQYVRMRGGEWQNGGTGFTYNCVGDGEETEFDVGLAIASVAGAVLSNPPGAAQTIGRAGQDTGKDWYWDPTGLITQDPGGTPLASEQILTVEFERLWEQRYPVSAGTTPVGLRFEAKGDTPNLVTSDEMSADGLASLRQFGDSSLGVSFDTTESGLHPGQSIPISIPDHDIRENMLITRVSVTEDSNSYNLRYSVEAARGEHGGTYVDWFRAALKGNKVYSGEAVESEDPMTSVSTVTLSASSTQMEIGVGSPAIPVPVAGNVLYLFIVQDGTGGRQITWKASDFSGSPPVDINPAANSETAFIFTERGGYWAMVSMFGGAA